ncbi:P2Y purinoceptor 14-like [Leuresthes tenuis]|uniref:P2Y purinoceptor 14-like n=1 Tax=Leuresthes tenuis TaxID=355514 RepID=UPI003B50C915
MSDLGGSDVTLSLNHSLDTTNNSNSTSCEPANTSAHMFFMAVYGLMFLVGLILNGFTLRVYFCSAQQQMSSSVTVYLKNLAAADFLISLCLPMRILNYSSNSGSIRRAYCNFGASAFYLNMYASILFMGYIAANRYLKIVRPLGTHVLQRVRPARIISMVTWGSLLAVTGSYIILSLLTQEVPDHLPNMVSCDSLHSHQLRMLYKVTHICSAAIFLVVLVSLVFFYYSTSNRLSLAQQKQPASSSSRALNKSRRNMLVLVSVFAVCFVPYHLVRLPYAFQRNWWCWSRWLFYLKEVTIMLSALNVCLDPLIYFLFCKAFRMQLSLRRANSTTQIPTQAAIVERRSSDRLTSIRNMRKMSLPTSVL